ncbi:MAG: hypothetical protein ACLPXB_03245 [Thiobacillaceae bacterium]
MNLHTEALRREAERQLQRGDASRAKQLAREIIVSEADNAAALNMLARAITSHDRLQEAICNARAAIGADGNSAHFFVTLGGITPKQRLAMAA